VRERYFVDAELEDDVDEVGIFKYTVEFYDILMMECFVDFNLGQQLNHREVTFCLALFFCSETLSITFIA